MSVESLDPAGTVQRALEFAAQNLTIERLLIKAGLDPANITYDAIFNRLLDVALASITFSNVLAFIGGIFLVASFVVRTIVPMRVLCIVSIVFLLAASALSGSVNQFFMYFLALPVNIIRLVQIRNLIRKARSSAQGTLSLDWLRPFMTPRSYRKGDVLFHKGDEAAEMFLTVSGKFLVSEIKVEIPPERILGELGFLSPSNIRTQSVECIEDGEVLTIDYDKLNELYLQSPEFGYYFLRLTSDRLLQNHARLEKLVDQSKAELAALTAADRNQTDGTTNLSRVVFSAFKGIRSIRGLRRHDASAEETASTDPLGIAIARRRFQAQAIVERHANYSAISGFIPLPVANVAAVTTVLVRMVKALDELYGVPFEYDRAYGLVVGLMGGVMPGRLAAVAATASLYFVPGFNLIGLAVSSTTASAYARAIGGMIIDHFERDAAIQRARHAAIRGWRDTWPIRSVRNAGAWSRSIFRRPSPETS